MTAELDASALAAARRAMVERQIRPSDVTRLDLLEAFLETPREAFLPRSKRGQAYVGDHVEVAPGRYELDPRVLAKMIDALEPRESDLALVLGSGGGYAAAVLSRVAAAVVAVEPNAELAQLAASGFAVAGGETVIAHQGPLAEGCAKHAPYNVVLVAGGVARELPDALFEQLAEGGRLAAVVMDGAAGRCELYLRSGGAVGARPIFDASAPILPGFEPPARFEF